MLLLLLLHFQVEGGRALVPHLFFPFSSLLLFFSSVQCLTLSCQLPLSHSSLGEFMPYSSYLDHFFLPLVSLLGHWVYFLPLPLCGTAGGFSMRRRRGGRVSGGDSARVNTAELSRREVRWMRRSMFSFYSLILDSSLRCREDNDLHCPWNRFPEP